MDTAGVERVDLRALGGIDNTVVNDLSATDVRNIGLDLETAIGGGAGDGAVDTTDQRHWRQRHDHDRAQARVDVTRLAAIVKIEHSEAANDLLNVKGSTATTQSRARSGLQA